MPLQIRSKGTVARAWSLSVRVAISLDAIEGPYVRIGQAVEMAVERDNNTFRAKGRLIEVVKADDDGLTRALAEFGPDAPEKRPGSEISVTIDAGSIPNVLHAGRALLVRSNSEVALFRMDRRSGIAERCASVTDAWWGTSRRSSTDSTRAT